MQFLVPGRLVPQHDAACDALNGAPQPGERQGGPGGEPGAFLGDDGPERAVRGVGVLVVGQHLVVEGAAFFAQVAVGADDAGGFEDREHLGLVHGVQRQLAHRAGEELLDVGGVEEDERVTGCPTEQHGRPVVAVAQGPQGRGGPAGLAYRAQQRSDRRAGGRNASDEGRQRVGDGEADGFAAAGAGRSRGSASGQRIGGAG